jgi:hypothetical protein
MGLDRGNYGFEIGCKNCSNEDAPVRFTRLTDPRTSSATVAAGGLGYNQTIGGDLRRPRQWIATAHYKF